MMAEQRRVRLIVDIDPGLRKRIKVAAASRDVPVRAYVSSILERVVPGAEAPMTRDDVEQLRRIRASVMGGRIFEDDSADILREERQRRIPQNS
jgi:plasmid stability protein